MSDTDPIDPRPVPETQPSNPGGPAGWPGATHFGKGVEDPVQPPPPRVEEVEAVPLTKSQARGPAIEVEAERVASEPTAAQKPSDTGTPGGSTAPPPPRSPTPAATPHAGTRLWAVLCHLAYLIPLNIPGLVVTALIWVCTRRDDPFSDDQAREALNFQLFYACVSFLVGITCVLSWLYFPLWLVGAVLSVVAAVEAGDGKKHRYPYIFRLIR